MAGINEIKEQMTVVQSVGNFTNALQQIATIRMVRLRTQVLTSRPFVETAVEMMKELASLRNQIEAEDLLKMEKQKENDKSVQADLKQHAVIIITSNQGLTGRYNMEIFDKVEKLIAEDPQADYFVIGKKGQEYYAGAKFAKVAAFPYEVEDDFGIQDLQRLIRIFDYYGRLTVVYSRYINTATREVVALSVITPKVEADPTISGPQGKYTYEPDIFHLIDQVGNKLRGALFQQQIFDARLAQYSAQMLGMKTASDNAVTLLSDLRMEYNKQRRKMIDKKISEVFAGSALW